MLFKCCGVVVVGIDRWRRGQVEAKERRPIEGCTNSVQSRRGGMKATAAKVMAEQRWRTSGAAWCVRRGGVWLRKREK